MLIFEERLSTVRPELSLIQWRNHYAWMQDLLISIVVTHRNQRPFNVAHTYNVAIRPIGFANVYLHSMTCFTNVVVT